MSIERLSIELTNHCTKGCWFCYNASRPQGETRWTVDELVGLILDCQRNGLRAVSFGGGEPLEFAGIFELLERLRGVLFRSLTTHGLLLTPEVLDRLIDAQPDKVHISIHFPEVAGEVRRVLTQVQELADRGIRSGINLLVRRSNLVAVQRAAEQIRGAGIDPSRVVYLPMRGFDTPSPTELAHVAGGAQFQSMTCLMECQSSPRFCSIAWDRTGAKVNCCAPVCTEYMMLRSEKSFYYEKQPFLQLGFRRGFIDETHADPATFLTVADALLSQTPVQRVWLRNEGIETLGRVLACEQLRALPVLDLSGHWLASAGVEVLIDSGGLARLRGIDLSGNQLTTDDIERLAAAPAAAGLEVLELGQANAGGHWDTTSVNNMVGDRGLAAIAESPYFGRLRRLNLEQNNIGPDGAMALAASSRLQSLRELVLDWNAIGPAGVQALAAARGLAHLEILSLVSNALDADIAPDIFAGDGLKSLRQLNLSSTRIGDVGARALATASQFAGLQVLNLSGCEIGPEGIHALTSYPQFAALTTLDLTVNPLGDDGVKALADSPFLGNIRSLNLADCRVGDLGASALARSAVFSNLERLDLGLNAGPDQPPARLSWIPMREFRNAITGAVLTELQERFGTVRWQTFPDFDVTPQ